VVIMVAVMERFRNVLNADVEQGCQRWQRFLK
jgi:hypothetical protein